MAVAEHGYSLRFSDPAAMLAWCDAAAVNLPSSLSPSEAGLLLAHLGNAHRVACNFSEAEAHIRQAHAADPTEPLILEFYAALMKDKRELHVAAGFLSRAATLRRSSGPTSSLATTLMQCSLLLDEAGLPGAAADAALGAMELIGSLPPTDERERLARNGLQNLATYLVNSGRAREALWVVKSCKAGLMMGGEVFRNKVDWLMADIAGALGEMESAVATYEQVRSGFIALGHTQEIAMVTLDLARLLLKTQPLRARQEALTVWPILDALGISRDAREAKLLAALVETGAEAPLLELSTALRSGVLARRRL